MNATNPSTLNHLQYVLGYHVTEMIVKTPVYDQIHDQLLDAYFGE